MTTADAICRSTTADPSPKADAAARRQPEMEITPAPAPRHANSRFLYPLGSVKICGQERPAHDDDAGNNEGLIERLAKQ